MTILSSWKREERNKKIVKRLLECGNQTLVAKEFGLSRQTVQKLWNRYTAPGTRMIDVRNEKRRNHIVELVKSRTYSVPEIAQILEISYITAQKLLKELNIELDPGRSRKGPKPSDTYAFAVGESKEDWTILERLPKDQFSQNRYFCQCKCGVRKDVLEELLVSGQSKSCRRCAAARRWEKQKQNNSN